MIYRKKIIAVLFLLIVAMLSNSYAGSAVNPEVGLIGMNLIGASNCSLSMGVLALPNGETSHLSYVYGDNITMLLRVVNKCPFTINHASLAIINQSSMAEQGLIWTFENLTPNRSIDLSKDVVAKESLNSSLSVLVYDMTADNSRFYGDMTENFLNLPITKLVYTPHTWDRSIDFTVFPPIVTDKIVMSTDEGVEGLVLRYDNKDMFLNFVHVFYCKIDGEACLVDVAYEKEYTELIVNLNNPLNETTIGLSYTLRNSVNYDPFYFPFDKIETTGIVFPDGVYLKSSNGVEEVNYFRMIRFLITQPNGFKYDQKATEANLSRIDSCSELHYLLPNNESDKELEYFLQTFLTQKFTEPKVNLLGTKGNIIWTNGLDKCNELKQFFFIFYRGSLYRFSLWIPIAAIIVFILLSIRKPQLYLIRDYFLFSVAFIFGNLLIFPRPFDITLVEVVTGSGLLLLILVNLFFFFFNRRERHINR